MSTVVGLDGCKGGWVAAVVQDGQLARIEFQSSARAALDAHPDAAVFAFDIPIGLSKDGRRKADEKAREFLGPRSSSVFNAPAREVLDIAVGYAGTTTHQQAYRLANEATKRVSGHGLSSQSFALFTKIREVGEVAGDPRVFEAHPEVTFAALAGEGPLSRKTSWDGLMQRRALLAVQGLAIPDLVGDVSTKAAADDVVDAVACAWTAGRVAARTARSFPDPPERIDGRTVAIWC